MLVVDDRHKVEQRRIQTGPNRDTDVVVTSGLREGESVIVDAPPELKDDAAVTAAKP